MSAEVVAFYESMRSEADLQRLIIEKTTEGLYLEYKQKHDRRDGNLSDGDSKHFSKALSGFANADGGVLVWGIQTGAHELPIALKPISGIQDFHDRLKKSLINATQPVVDDVRLEIVHRPGATGAGYVKCLIPPSDKAPHRAMLADREYWKRTTEGFYRLEHFDLEDLFGRRPRPLLTMELDLRPRPDPDPHEELYFSFLNKGRGIAKHPGFMCRLKDDEAKIAGVQGAGMLNASALNKGQPMVACNDNEGVIHPNGITVQMGHATLLRPEKSRPLTVSLTWYCENMATRNAVTDVPPSTS